MHTYRTKHNITSYYTTNTINKLHVTLHYITKHNIHTSLPTYIQTYTHIHTYIHNRKGHIQVTGPRARPHGPTGWPVHRPRPWPTRPLPRTVHGPNSHARAPRDPWATGMVSVLSYIYIYTHSKGSAEALLAATVIVVFSSYVFSLLWFPFFFCPCFEIVAGDCVAMMGSCMALPWLRLL